MQAIEQSVNTYFYKLALDMGIDKLSHWMARFGFGQPTGIDLPGEASGVLPSREWKRAHRKCPGSRAKPSFPASDRGTGW